MWPGLQTPCFLPSDDQDPTPLRRAAYNKNKLNACVVRLASPSVHLAVRVGVEVRRRHILHPGAHTDHRSRSMASSMTCQMSPVVSRRRYQYFHSCGSDLQGRAPVHLAGTMASWQILKKVHAVLGSVTVPITLP